MDWSICGSVVCFLGIVVVRGLVGFGWILWIGSWFGS